MKNIKILYSCVFITVFSIVGLLMPTSTTYALNTSCGVDTSIIDCTTTADGDSSNLEKTGLWGLMLLAINILTAGVGVAALAGLIYGAVLYTTSGDSPEQVKKSHTIIKNVVIGLVMYALLYSLMNYLIPGGIFN